MVCGEKEERRWNKRKIFGPLGWGKEEQNRKKMFYPGEEEWRRRVFGEVIAKLIFDLKSKNLPS